MAELNQKTNNSLHLLDLSAQFFGDNIYSALSISLTESAILAIKAPNGTGKTTLLKQIAGLHHLDSGEIRWRDKSIKTMKDYHRELIWIGDAHGLIPHLTVAEQLEYIAKMWGEVQRLPATIHYLELSTFLSNKISELSSGWKRRVAIARLLLIPASIWVLDEPFNHLDEHATYLLGGLISSHADKGGITIFSAPQNNLPKLPNHNIISLELLDFI
jgi:heme exporter protein A